MIYHYGRQIHTANDLRDMITLILDRSFPDRPNYRAPRPDEKGCALMDVIPLLTETLKPENKKLRDGIKARQIARVAGHFAALGEAEAYAQLFILRRELTKMSDAFDWAQVEILTRRLAGEQAFDRLAIVYDAIHTHEGLAETCRRTAASAGVRFALCPSTELKGHGWLAVFRETGGEVMAWTRTRKGVAPEALIATWETDQSCANEATFRRQVMVPKLRELVRQLDR